MSKSLKIILGIITLLPFVFMGGYFLWFMSFFMRMSDNLGAGDPDAVPRLMFGNMGWMFLFLGMAMLISFGLMIYYIVHVVNNKKIDSNERLVWILVFIFANMIGYPVYWYMRIWKGEDVQPAVKGIS
ncbi:MAG: PLDc N-terminal domain-containing protein [Chitinophagaceae bacterium]|nr:PLDc N-terminal domain-containing protein [Chitinophagaceae bacterium]